MLKFPMADTPPFSALDVARRYARGDGGDAPEVTTADILQQMPQPAAERGFLLPIMRQGSQMSPAVPGIIHEPYEAIRRLMSKDYYRPGSREEGPIQDAANVAGAVALPGLGLNAVGMMPKNAVGIFGGRLGAERLAAQGTTAPKNALELAERMHAEGATRDEIRAATNALLAQEGPQFGGVHQGKEGLWRFEIPDNAAEYRPGALDAKIRDQTGLSLNEVREKGVAAPLSDVLREHPTLYDAYPGMALTPWKALPPDKMVLPHYGGAWRGELSGMEINNAYSPRLGQGKSITLHEAQHGLQDSEGFAKGANQGMFELTPEQYAGGQRQLAQVIDARLIKSEAAHTGKTPAEVEFMFRHEYGLNPQPGAHNWFHHSIDELNSMEQRLRTRMDEGKDPNRAYHNTAGEVEARNVQKRMDMTPQERRATPPWETEDVPTAEQVVRSLGVRR